MKIMKSTLAQQYKYHIDSLERVSFILTLKFDKRSNISLFTNGLIFVFALELLKEKKKKLEKNCYQSLYWYLY